MRILRSVLFPLVVVGTLLGQPQTSRRIVYGEHGMVVSADSLASAVGREILKKGGNAIDAGVAVGFALAVTFPIAGNIGGGGFMVIRLADGRSTTIDFREKAPLAATRNMFLGPDGNVVEGKTQVGALASGVPGSVAGLLYALDHYGTMKRAAVLNPAIDLARHGFVIENRFLANEIRNRFKVFKMFPASLDVFSRNGRPLALGDSLIQSDLASTLRRIKEDGTKGFYQGMTADRIVEEMQRSGGIITHRDLESYTAVERPPVVGSYRGYKIISMAPPSSGGIVLLEMLNVLEGFNLKKTGKASPETMTLLAESMKLAYADRSEYMGDPDFYAVPQGRLISKQYAKKRRALIHMRHVLASRRIMPGKLPPADPPQTTHFSIIDRWGNCVSVTTTINDFFGCGVLVRGAGFFLNNEMDDFSAKPGVPNQFGLVGGTANQIEPSKRMLSAMTPTIVLKDHKPFLVIGTPGGSRIITTVLQIIVNVIDFGMDIREAIDAPRIHHQWRPDSLFYEHKGMSKKMQQLLHKRGYTVVELRGEYGRAEGILIDPRTGVYEGATDRRGHGAALGY